MDRLLESAAGTALSSRHGRDRAKAALREAAARWRAEDPGAATRPRRFWPPPPEISRHARRPDPVRVVNATGVLLHTNLGRAPLAAAAVAAAGRAAGFSTLELDLATGHAAGAAST